MDNKEVTVERLAEFVSGNVIGDPSLTIDGIKPLETAQAHHASFLVKNAKLDAAALLAKTSAGAIFVSSEIGKKTAFSQIVVKNPYLAVIQASELFYQRPKPNPGIHHTAIIAKSASIASDCCIGPYVVIGENCKLESGVVIHANAVVYDGCVIGENSEIHANAVLREGVVLGKKCLIQPGAVLGGDGFGYVPDPDIAHRHIPHTGSLKLSDQVDVGANSSIDRGTLGDTTIGEFSKIDSIVQIGHNNTIGRKVLICGVNGIAGSCNIGDGAVLGGHVGVADHVNIAAGARVGGKSGVGRDIKKGEDVMGYPVTVSPKQFWRQFAAIQKLPKLLLRVSKLEKQLEKIINR